jgi:hypothetical protein
MSWKKVPAMLGAAVSIGAATPLIFPVSNDPVNLIRSDDVSKTVNRKCTYQATNPLLPRVNKSFNIDPNGTASFPVLAPPALSTYHIVVCCHGTFDGKEVQFVHEEQDVSL